MAMLQMSCFSPENSLTPVSSEEKETQTPQQHKVGFYTWFKLFQTTLIKQTSGRVVMQQSEVCWPCSLLPVHGVGTTAWQCPFPAQKLWWWGHLFLQFLLIFPSPWGHLSPDAHPTHAPHNRCPKEHPIFGMRMLQTRSCTTAAPCSWWWPPPPTVWSRG